jgi:uncharacterized protein
VNDQAAPQKGACVICGKPKDEKYKPFCSTRCQQVDLHRWFTGKYALPVVETEESSDDE